MSRVLVTGIHGFVGSNLVLALKDNYTLYGVDVVSPKKEGVSNTYAWSDLEKIPPVDMVIHLAGKAHDTKNRVKDRDYFDINTGLTRKIFDWFCISGARKFVFISSVKAVADSIEGILTESKIPSPQTPYGKSKLMAEEYIQSKGIPQGKTYYILRPCMIHGPGNKGNLNLLYQFIKHGIPYPLGNFQNKRSLLSIDNFCFVMKELLKQDIPSGIYNVSDDTPISTEEIVKIIGIGTGKKIKIWKIPKKIIQCVAFISDIFCLPFNSERLKKLTENYVVSNHKLIEALGVKLPMSSKEGLLKTICSFKGQA